MSTMTNKHTDVEEIKPVLWEDQQQINLFGRLNTRMHELQAEIKTMENRIQNVDDAEQEIYITDDIKFSMGEVFVTVEAETAGDLLSKTKDELQKEKDVMEKELNNVLSKMKELKAKLYAKFGKAINLEDKEDK